MTPTFWLSVGQTVVFLAVCGFALWAARIVTEAGADAAAAADQVAEAARDAERTAADIRQMRDMLQTLLDQQQSRVDPHRQQQLPGAPMPAGWVQADAAGADAVRTPQATIDSGDDVRSRESLPRDSSRSQRGRHARATGSPWTAALRAATVRSSRDR